MSSPCTLTLDDGTHYDLSPLGSTQSDYIAQVGETSYNLNICRGVVGELHAVEDPDTVGGYVRKDQGDFVLGRVHTNLTLSPMTNEPMYVITDGSPCPLNPDARASTAIRFICSPSDFNAGKPLLVATLPPQDPCHFYFEWRSHVACPTNPKSSLESGHYIAFGAILAIAILTWFGGHTLYNRFYLGRRGSAQFPLFHIPRPKISLPTFKSRSNGNGQGSSGGPKWGSWRRRSQRSGNGYTSIRADENDEEEGFAGRFSLDDDELDADAEDLTGVNETNAWRNQAATNGSAGVNGEAGAGAGAGKGKNVGVHQGLVDI
ncbi:hypothetical protein I203_101276 [Kwoniella mangroviensis CBS 8507]|uniref:uncharacterized protein n=1 Tax=Kwoniella mangroviensis CBS 8507 TaxID=1296122 RepID=UPI00080CCCF8|nr:uncharacterized protein I203_02913 [Kwoniella mangroviensis CBS 8507]OCF68249.1 hypothetical protein I203_02913 [Kwoniella mangroviensis CBS 8507]